MAFTQFQKTSNKVPYEVGIAEYSEPAKSMMEGSERGNRGLALDSCREPKLTLSTFNILSRYVVEQPSHFSELEAKAQEFTVGTRITPHTIFVVRCVPGACAFADERAV
jgi:hypothetical protein